MLGFNVVLHPDRNGTNNIAQKEREMVTDERQYIELDFYSFFNQSLVSIFRSTLGITSISCGLFMEIDK